jgi:ABC-type sugar transport system ATPase subunit
MEDADILCSTRNLTKIFPGVVALNRVNIEIRRGEVHAIIGENGAGKSTLMNLLSGVYQPDEGHIEFEGKPVRLKDPKHARELGIAMIHQELSLSPYMSVAENIYQGRMLTKSGFWLDRKAMYEGARVHLHRLNVRNIDPRTLVRELSVSQKQLVEIAKAVSQGPKMLIMDEPTSSLTAGEISTLLDIIRALKAEGVSILFISHKFEEIMEIADRITVMRDGQHIRTLDKRDATIDQLVSLMVGREFEKKLHRTFISDYSDREVVLEVRDLCVEDKVKNASFKLYKGEVLGLTGLVGSGRSELLQGIFGMNRVVSGTVLVGGKPAVIRHPSDAIRLGIGLVPENRKEQGAFLHLSVLDNMTMVNLRELTFKSGFLNNRLRKVKSREYVDALAVKTPGISQIAVNLSGGNQQKTILARWLMNRPSILFLDEPTHGIDIGAKTEIYRLIDDLVKQGVSIILLSSELPEVLTLCDRIMVMHNGEIRGTLKHDEADQVRIMSLTVKDAAESRQYA